MGMLLMDERGLQFDDEREEAIYLIVRSEPGLTVRQIRERMPEPRPSLGWTHTLLHRIVSRGLLERPRGRRRWWRVADDQ